MQKLKTLFFMFGLMIAPYSFGNDEGQTLVRPDRPPGSRPSLNSPVAGDFRDILLQLNDQDAVPSSENPEHCRSLLRTARNPAIPVWNVRDESQINEQAGMNLQSVRISLGDSLEPSFYAAAGNFRQPLALILKNPDGTIQTVCDYLHYNTAQENTNDGSKQLVIKRETNCKPGGVIQTSQIEINYHEDNIDISIEHENRDENQSGRCSFSSRLPQEPEQPESSEKSVQHQRFYPSSGSSAR
jgi:hypothetical protein